MSNNRSIQIVFAITPNVAPYLSTITHGIYKLGVNHIVLVEIIDVPSGHLIDDFHEFRLQRLEKALLGLSKGEYYSFRYNQHDQQWNENIESFEVPIHFEGYNMVRQHCSKGKIDHREINYKFLRKGLDRIVREYENQGEYFVDLTCVPKRVALDGFTACISLGIEDVVAFELKVPAKGKYTLYHNLKLESDFELLILPKSEAFLESLRKIVSNKNRPYLIIVIFSILVIAVTSFVIYYQFYDKPEDKVFLTALIALELIAVVSGIFSIIGSWESVSLFMKINKK